MSFVLGLTGSIGMGKSTTAQMFSDAGIPVWDADAAVHYLYSKDKKAIAAIGDIAPTAVIDGIVSRNALKAEIKADEYLLQRIESIIHPLVAQNRAEFIETNSAANLIVLDIPLIHEKSNQDKFDAVLVVSVDAETQRQRVLARAGMTEEIFQLILSRQTPDAEKRKRADYVIETYSMDQTRKDVQTLIQKLAGD